MRLTQLLCCVFWLLSSASLGSAQLQNDSHIALLIGSDNYQNAPKLTQSVQDATVLANRFHALGYSVILLKDPSQREILKTLAAIKHAARNAQQIVVYLSGHGVQTAGNSYYLTVDSKPPSQNGQTSGIPVALFLKAFSEVPRQKIVLFDACRTPAAFQARFQSPGAVVDITQHAGSLVAFAAGPGQPAYEGARHHSPFARALLRQLLQPQQPIVDMLRTIRLSVIRDTQGQQVPWVTSSLLSEVRFEIMPRKAMSGANY